MICIVTKLEMLGGSERRAAELNKTLQSLGVSTKLVATGKVSTKLDSLTDARIVPIEQAKQSIEESELVIVICSDSKQITTLDYWQSVGIDTTKPKKWLFVFNFLISSSISLGEWTAKDITLAPTSQKFFDEVSEQDRYRGVRHLRRIISRSPISKSYRQAKVNMVGLKICGYAKGNSDKWNERLPELCRQITEKHNTVQFLFQGCGNDLRNKLNELSNVEAVKENTYPVEQILRNSNVLLYYPTWKREEPWCRVIGESMMAGTPAITTNKGGSLDQIIHGNTGFLCNEHDDFVKAVDTLASDPELLAAMSQNCLAESEQYESEVVTKKLLKEVIYGLWHMEW